MPSVAGSLEGPLALRTHPVFSKGVPPVLRHAARGQWLSAVVGVGLGVGTSLLIYLAANSDSFLGRVFDMGRVETAIPVVISSLFFWSVLICVRRWRTLQAVESMSARGIVERAADVLRSKKNLDELSKDLQCPVSAASPLLRRLQAVVGQWGVRPSLQDANVVLEQHIIHDAESVHAGYSLVRTFVWALPVLGLIGTVLGISQAVGGFAQFLGGNIDDVATIKKNLVGVTGGLSFAFLITLQGLLTSLIVMLAASSLQTREEKLYATIQQDITDIFLPALQQVLPESTGRTGQEELNDWRKTLHETADGVLAGVRDLGTRLAMDMQSAHEARSRAVGESWCKTLQDVAAEATRSVGETATRALAELSAAQAAHHQGIEADAAAWQESLRKVTGGILTAVRDVGKRLLEAIDARHQLHYEQTTQLAQAWRQDLESGAARLHEVLGCVTTGLTQAGHEFSDQLRESRAVFAEGQNLLAQQAQAGAERHAEVIAVMGEQTKTLQATTSATTTLAETTAHAVQLQAALLESMQQLRDANVERSFTSFVEAVTGQAERVQTLEAAVERLASVTGHVLQSQSTLHEAIRELREAGLGNTLASFRDSLCALGPILDEFRQPFVLRAVPVDGQKPPYGRNGEES